MRKLMRFTSIGSVILLAVLLATVFAQRRAVVDYGTIDGVVVTDAGTPLANASVYVFQNGGSPITTTDEHGRFKLTGVAIGRHLVLAYKESDGFPNPVWSFYNQVPRSPAFPVVDVRNEAVSNIVVRL